MTSFHNVRYQVTESRFKPEPLHYITLLNHLHRVWGKGYSLAEVFGRSHSGIINSGGQEVTGSLEAFGGVKNFFFLMWEYHSYWPSKGSGGSEERKREPLRLCSPGQGRRQHSGQRSRESSLWFWQERPRHSFSPWCEEEGKTPPLRGQDTKLNCWNSGGRSHTFQGTGLDNREEERLKAETKAEGNQRGIPSSRKSSSI